MITWTRKSYVAGRFFGVGDCLSKDTKPTAENGVKVYNGSVLRELDTGKEHRFDGENETWIEWTGSGGGGGGSTLPDAEGVSF